MNTSNVVTGVVAVLFVGAVCRSALAAETTPPTVTGITPAPDAVLSSPPPSVVVAFDEEVDAETVNLDSLRLVRSGGDGTFTDGNEVEVAPASVTRTGASGDEAMMDLAGASMPDDVYKATVVGGPPPALSFDGADDLVDCGDILNDVTVPFTVSAWVNRTSGGEMGVLASDETNHYDGFWLMVNGDDTLQVSYGDATGTGGPDRRSKSGGATVPVGVWVHLAATVRGPTDMSIYIDGVDAGGAYSGTGGAMAHTGQPLRIGVRTPWGPLWFQGMIDEVRVWDVARTQAEIQEDMFKSVPPGTPGLAARWSFNEGTGQTVADSSGNGLDGTLGADASVASDDPSWATPGAPVKSAVADLAGNLLDGDGDTFAGGDFTSTFTITGNAPAVDSTSPYDGEPDVDVFSSVSVAFSEPMDRPTVESAFSVLPDVPGSFSWSGGTMIFRPSSRLYDNTAYTVTIGIAALDWAGDPIAGDYVFSFTTTDVLSSGEPLPAGYIGHILHLGTQRQDRILGGDIDADYFAQAGLGSETVQRPSEGIAVNLAPATTTETPMVWTPHVYDGGNNYWCMNYANEYTMYWAIYVISPSEREAQLHYHVDDDAAAWIDGQHIFTEYGPDFGVNREFMLPGGVSLLLFKFAEHSGDDFVHFSIQHRDGSAMTDLRYTLRDPVMPQIESRWPEADATDVSRWTYVLIRFTKPMDVTVDPATAAGITGGAAAGTWEWVGNDALVWTPTSPLDATTTYVVTVDPLVARDLAGNWLDGASSFTFTTGEVAGTPSVTGVDPSEGETGSVIVDLHVTGAGFESGAIAPVPGAVPFGGHYYEYLAGPAGWHAARDDCVAKGGHLVTISSAEENAFVWGLAPPGDRWIGLSDEATEGVWQWVTGEPVGFVNWAAGQPDDFNGTEDYAHMWPTTGDGAWNDIVVSASYPYVREYEPVPPEVRLSMSGEADIVATNVRMADAGTLLVDLDLTGAVLGDWDVVVTNPDGAWGALPGGFTVYNVAPYVVSTSLADLATDVPLSSAITVTFSEDMDPAATALAFSIDPAVAGSPTVSGAVLTLVPSGGLESGTDYTVMVSTAATDLVGNALATIYLFSFATEDIAPPAEVTALAATASSGQVELSWRNPSDVDFAGVVILQSVQNPPTGLPADGTAYAAGSFIENALVICVDAGIPGDGQSWTATGLWNGTEYFYAVFARDDEMNYSAGAAASGTPSEGDDNGGMCGAGAASPISLLALFALAFGRLRRALR